MDNMHLNNRTNQGANNNQNARRGGREGSPVRDNPRPNPELLEPPALEQLGQAAIQAIARQRESRERAALAATEVRQAIERQRESTERAALESNHELLATARQQIQQIRNGQLLPEQINHLINTGEPSALRVLIYSNQPLSENNLRDLRAHPSPKVRAAFIRAFHRRPTSEEQSPEQIDHLINTGEPRVLCALIYGNQALSRDNIRDLRAHPSRQVRDAFMRAFHRRTPSAEQRIN